MYEVEVYCGLMQFQGVQQIPIQDRAIRAGFNKLLSRLPRHTFKLTGQLQLTCLRHQPT